MPSLARTERAALCDLLLAVGPDAPTLCAGWTTRDLAAHLVVREHRPDAAAGIVVPALAGHNESVRRHAAERPFADLVATVRRGAPVWSPMWLAPLDDRLNGFEYLVHHEDVRRAQPGWEPRPLPEAVQDDVWARLAGFARLGFRSSRFGVVLRRPEGAAITARKGEPVVTVTGDPVELALLGFGRSEHRARVDGDPAAVAAFLAEPRGA